MNQLNSVKSEKRRSERTNFDKLKRRMHAERKRDSEDLMRSLLPHLLSPKQMGRRRHPHQSPEKTRLKHLSKTIDKRMQMPRGQRMKGQRALSANNRRHRNRKHRAWSMYII